MVVRHSSRPERGGFTLIELLAAIAITIVLLAAVFVAMDTLLQQMDAGRTIVEQSAIGNRIVSRVAAELNASLGPTVPASVLTGTDSSAINAANNASGSSSSASGTTTTQSAVVVFQVGVVGDSTSVSVFTTRLTPAIVAPPTDPSATSPVVADIRRSTYFLAPSGAGLAKQELLQPTADLVDSIPTDKDDHTKILAPEVKTLTFRYYDGTNWQDSWDGTQPGPDGKTPLGPPALIEITMGIQMDGSDSVQTYRHTVAIPTAPGTAGQNSSSSSGSGSSTTTMP
jgi:hypothetical protein